jgi:hypothetical protein
MTLPTASLPDAPTTSLPPERAQDLLRGLAIHVDRLRCLWRTGGCDLNRHADHLTESIHTLAAWAEESGLELEAGTADLDLALGGSPWSAGPVRSQEVHGRMVQYLVLECAPALVAPRIDPAVTPDLVPDVHRIRCRRADTPADA